MQTSDGHQTLYHKGQGVDDSFSNLAHEHFDYWRERFEQYLMYNLIENLCLSSQPGGFCWHRHY